MEQNLENYYNIKKLFINMLLKKGKKNNSEKIFNNILIQIKKETNQNPRIVLYKSINNLLPKIKLIKIQKNKRKWKRKQFFLIFLQKDKQIKISILWLLKNYKNIIKEIIDTSKKKKSKSIKIKKKIYGEIKKQQHNITI